MTYRIEVEGKRVLVFGSMPITDMEALHAFCAGLGATHMFPGVATVRRALLALASEEDGQAWVKECEESVRMWHRDPLEAWRRGPHTGISSLTIDYALSGRAMPEGCRPSVPHDSGDFGRCLGLLAAAPHYRERLGEVADAYPRWGALVLEWETLERLYNDGKHDELNVTLAALVAVGDVADRVGCASQQEGER